MQNEFDSPTAALAVIPKDQTFAVFERTRGRPTDVPNPDTQENRWTHDQYIDAITRGKIPKVIYFLRPYASNGKTLTASSRRITLNLEMADDSATVGDPMPADIQQQPLMQMPHIQESVLNALMGNMDDYKLRCLDLEDKIEELQDENADLKLKIADLENRLANSTKDHTLGQTANQILVEVFRNPAGLAMIASKFAGSDLGVAVGEAANRAASNQK